MTTAPHVFDLDDDECLDALIIALTDPDRQHLPGAGLVAPPCGLVARRAVRDSLCHCGATLAQITDLSIALCAYFHADRCLGLTPTQWIEACALTQNMPASINDTNGFVKRCQDRLQRIEQRF